MQTLYFLLAASHIVAIVVTGILWTLLDLGYSLKLRLHLRDIRAVHFGSLYLVPWFLGLAYAFDKLAVPALHQTRDKLHDPGHHHALSRRPFRFAGPYGKSAISEHYDSVAARLKFISPRNVVHWQIASHRPSAQD
jgi:hypothetical protein